MGRRMAGSGLGRLFSQSTNDKGERPGDLFLETKKPPECSLWWSRSPRQLYSLPTVEPQPQRRPLRPLPAG